jgi:hypothetical protein
MRIEDSATLQSLMKEFLVWRTAKSEYERETEVIAKYSAYLEMTVSSWDDLATYQSTEETGGDRLTYTRFLKAYTEKRES